MISIMSCMNMASLWVDIEPHSPSLYNQLTHLVYIPTHSI